MTTRLIADIGGTNTRIALFDETDNSIHSVSSFSNTEYKCLEAIIEQWLDSLQGPPPIDACIAVAAPPSGDRVNMINIGWSFSCRELAQRFEMRQFNWINDFQANAYALPYLGSKDLELLESGVKSSCQTLAIVGPGTGLGGATLRWADGKPMACNSEPGHAGLSPATDLEIEVFQRLLPNHGNIHAELLLSGSGLVRLYETLAAINGSGPELLTPEQVSRLGLQSEDANCRQALETFCSLLGSACGDFVLSNGAYGGLFMAGGIIPRMIPFLRNSDFLQRFRAKGAMSEQLAAVPVHVITAAYPGLIGAAHAPLQGS